MRQAKQPFILLISEEESRIINEKLGENVFPITKVVSVYPPVKWEGIMNAVNRLPVDVAER